MFGFQDEANYRFLILRAGAAAEVLDMVNGRPTVVPGCAGEVIQSDEIQVDNLDTVRLSPEVVLEVTDGQVVASISSREVLRCNPEQASEPGRVAVAVLGGLSQKLRLDRVSVNR